MTDGPSSQIHYAPLGESFVDCFVRGFIERFGSLAPEDISRCEIWVNTGRAKRVLSQGLSGKLNGLLPRFRVLSEIENAYNLLELPERTEDLKRSLELTQLVKRLIDAEPDVAPRSSAFDLANRLSALIDEFHGEGVDTAELYNVDVEQHSSHWERSLTFLKLVDTYVQTDETVGPEQRQTMVVDALSELWELSPPRHPVILAGSTGSRGTTAKLMSTLAQHNNGYVVLPGFDTNLGEEDWRTISGQQDHPQYRFFALAKLMDGLPSDFHSWAKPTPIESNRVETMSLALRPAPFTDQWLRDGPKLGDLRDGFSDVTLIQAQTPKEEAQTLALGMRVAIQDGKTVALITPDRNLTRRVTSALDLWGIQPDDSAGQPLQLAPPGRFFNHVLAVLNPSRQAHDLLALLKHPICHSGEDRNIHLLRTRELEVFLRKRGATWPDAALLARWIDKSKDTDEGRQKWAAWLDECVSNIVLPREASFSQFLNKHIEAAERFAAGSTSENPGELWLAAAGRKMKSVIEILHKHADSAGLVSLFDYRSIFSSVVAKEEVRDRDAGDPRLLILGTLEARMVDADLVILAGLNDGIWPPTQSADPWLNRKMRKDLGLLLPERQIGLSAHDFQQAMSRGEVWLSRSVRSDDADTVPSRWINRLTNLLEGLTDQSGPETLAAMQARGQIWSEQAKQVFNHNTNVPPESRPSPCPPISARPKQLSVTQIKTLIRDPYAIYARKVLRLDKLNPIKLEADMPLRGTVMHAVFEEFIRQDISPADPTALDRLLEVAEQIITAQCPWPVTQQIWITKIEKIAPWFLQTEVNRQQTAIPKLLEAKGSTVLDNIEFSLTGYADRLDETPDGEIIIYDYKTGTLPSQSAQKHFDKQLLLEAGMVERGAFEELGPRAVHSATFLGLGTKLTTVDAPLTKHPAHEIWAEFEKLILSWNDEDRGYSARLAHFKAGDTGPYDHLSRFGEWDMTQQAKKVNVT